MPQTFASYDAAWDAWLDMTNYHKYVVMYLAYAGHYVIVRREMGGDAE